MSRNKIEGHYDGFVKGKNKRGLKEGKPIVLWSRNNIPTNRKQRKSAKINPDGYWSISYYTMQ